MRLHVATRLVLLTVRMGRLKLKVSLFPDDDDDDDDDWKLKKIFNRHVQIRILRLSICFVVSMVPFKP